MLAGVGRPRRGDDADRGARLLESGERFHDARAFGGRVRVDIETLQRCECGTCHGNEICAHDTSSTKLDNGGESCTPTHEGVSTHYRTVVRMSTGTFRTSSSSRSP